MKLWRAHCPSLQGFYSSEIYVVAKDREAARTKALEQFILWLDKRLDEYGHFADVNQGDDDEERETLKLYAAVDLDLSTNIREVSEGVWIVVRD